MSGDVTGFLGTEKSGHVGNIGRFAETLGDTFSGGKMKVWLAPPILARKGRDGRPRKSAFGGWFIKQGLPLLARLKGLRGGPLDPFAATSERRTERALIAAYEANLDRLTAGLTPDRLPLAIRLAQLPADIRGYGHVKDKAVTAVRAAEAELWAKWG